MAPTTKEGQRAELHKTIWRIANDLRGSVDGEIDQEWREYIAARREREIETIIADENLRPDETRVFVETAFRDGQIRTSGTAIPKVLPPVSRFSSDGGHGEKKQRVIQKLGAFFERFFGLSSIGERER